MIRLRLVCAASLALYAACADKAGTADEHDAGRATSEQPGSSTPMDAQVARDSARPPVDRDAAREPISCVNLQCQIHACPSGGTTSISGVVYDPAGKNPLYNVAVFIPNTTPEPFHFGASCDTCSSLYTGTPVASALTDASGRFKLDGVPAGQDIPLVIQIGKWRRQLKIASVAACRDNPQRDGTLRLPRNRAEGDIPKIAISTGGADTLECLLRRVGVDASEYVPGDLEAGHIHVYHGEHGSKNPVAPNTSPAAPESSASLWKRADSLLDYDIVLLSCEGDETQNMNQQALHDYASAGGRVFASHFHYAWFNSGPYREENLASWSAGTNELGDIDSDIVTTLPNGMPFVKGRALKKWLANVGALQGDQLHIQEARHNADVRAANTPSTAWIVAGEGTPDGGAGATQYFSFNTPTSQTPDDAAYCGRVVYSDLHVGAASGDDKGKPVPTGCADRALSPQEAALEFMLFDLSSCVTPDRGNAVPPPIF